MEDHKKVNSAYENGIGPINRKRCKFWVMGNCRETNCRFLHDSIQDTSHIVVEGRCYEGDSGENYWVTSADVRSGEEGITRVRDEGTVLCKFHLHGRCRYGEQCRFVHRDSESLRSVESRISCEVSISDVEVNNLMPVKELVGTAQDSASDILSRYSSKSVFNKFSERRHETESRIQLGDSEVINDSGLEGDGIGIEQETDQGTARKVAIQTSEILL